jgi:hypothetical protein
MAEYPKRAVGVTLQVDGDTWADVIFLLRAIVIDAQRDGLLHEGGSAGSTGSHTCRVTEDPTMTHDRYMRESAVALAAETKGEA